MTSSIKLIDPQPAVPESEKGKVMKQTIARNEAEAVNNMDLWGKLATPANKLIIGEKYHAYDYGQVEVVAVDEKIITCKLASGELKRFVCEYALGLLTDEALEQFRKS